MIKHEDIGLGRDEARWRAWAEVDAQALRHNVNVARRRCPDSGVVAVVKADAYGHGLEWVGEVLRNEVSFFGVATVGEALTLQKMLGGGAPEILLLGPLLPEEMAQAVKNGWHFALSGMEELEVATKVAAQVGRPASVHLAVDSGMGRMGALECDFLELCKSAVEREGVRVCGLASHLPSADEDVDFTRGQLTALRELMEEAGVICAADRPFVHLLNSAGICGFEAAAERTLIRPGLLLYGVAPLPECQEWLQPVLSLHARVRLVRRLPAGRSISYGRTYFTRRSTVVATLGIGYADGYPRSLGGRGASVLLQGHRCPLLGRVTMDQIMVDVTDLPLPAAVGDEAVLYGRQGGEEISVGEIARRADTISWEVLTRLSRRVPRVSREVGGAH